MVYVNYILLILVSEGLCALYCYANSYDKEEFKGKFGLFGSFLLINFIMPCVMSWVSKIH
jgi:hypothetical protein